MTESNERATFNTDHGGSVEMSGTNDGRAIIRGSRDAIVTCVNTVERDALDHAMSAGYNDEHVGTIYFANETVRDAAVSFARHLID